MTTGTCHAVLFCLLVAATAAAQGPNAAHIASRLAGYAVSGKHDATTQGDVDGDGRVDTIYTAVLQKDAGTLLGAAETAPRVFVVALTRRARNRYVYLPDDYSILAPARMTSGSVACGIRGHRVFLAIDYQGRDGTVTETLEYEVAHARLIPVTLTRAAYPVGGPARSVRCAGRFVKGIPCSLLFRRQLPRVRYE